MDPLEGQDPAAAVATDPQAAASVLAVQDNMETYDPETHIKVPKADLRDYDGRWGGVMHDAKAYADAKAGGRFDPGYDKIADLARQNNMTIDQVYEFITSDGSAGGQQQQQQYDIPGQPPAGQQPPEALTVDRYQKLRQQERAEDTAARQAADADSTRAQAFETEGEDVTRMLRDEFKFDYTADGQPDGPVANFAHTAMTMALNQVVKGDIPDWLSREDRAEALKNLVRTPTTSAQRQKAKAIFTENWKVLANENVSRFAKGQEGVPAATLGAGAGGSVTKDVNSMTMVEQAAELDRRVHARTGEHIDPVYDD